MGEDIAYKFVGGPLDGQPVEPKVSELQPVVGHLYTRFAQSILDSDWNYSQVYMHYKVMPGGSCQFAGFETIIWDSHRRSLYRRALARAEKKRSRTVTFEGRREFIEHAREFSKFLSAVVGLAQLKRDLGHDWREKV